MEANTTPELFDVSLRLGTTTNAEYKTMDEPKKVGTLNQIRKTPVSLFEAQPHCGEQREQRLTLQKKSQFITRDNKI